MDSVFQSIAQEFIYTRTYSRWLEEEKRREHYHETVIRYLDFMKLTIGDSVKENHYNHALEHMLNLAVMPSMRALWAAGKVLQENNFTGYNCSFVAITEPFVFSEIMFILMSGTGVGFSVEREFIDQLPYIENLTGNTVKVIVEDSREGWANALNLVLCHLWKGDYVEPNFDLVRDRGTRLKTMGGRASGPEPLKELFEFIASIFQTKREKRQRRLTTLDCLDIANKIGEVVVAGGVRRSSEISLSDLDDMSIAGAKSGEFWRTKAHRQMSNNSAVYHERPEAVVFLEEFGRLIRSRAGERGIFNREGAHKQMMSSGRRKDYPIIGVNPCGEILLRDQQLCNLSEVIVRRNDTLEMLRDKVKIATMFGVWQSTFTDFPFARPKWSENCKEERLLGVSLTGIMDHPVLNNVNDKMKVWLSDLKANAVQTAGKWSKRLGINMSAAITCVKPSGTVSQLTNCASGIHPRYAPYYIRRYRISVTDPLLKMMVDQGFKAYPEVGQDPQTASTMVLEFPTSAPEKAKTVVDYSALQQLEHWLVVKNFWCEHNPSITVYVGDEEWVGVAAWVYDHFDEVCGIAFLPRNDHVYQLAPYEEITEQKYRQLKDEEPVIDFTQLSKFELEDTTDGLREYACVGDKCDV